MTRSALILIVLGLLASGTTGAVLARFPDFLRGQIAESFAQAGLRVFGIGRVSAGLSSLEARDIRLDPYGFNTIETLRVRLSWPAFLAAKKVREVRVEKLSISTEWSALAAAPRIRRWLSPQTLSGLPLEKLSVEHAIVDIATPQGDLRLEGKALLQTTGKGRVIDASVWARQYQMSFETVWKGLVTDKTLQLDAELPEGKLNFGPLRLSRANGWLGLKTDGGLPSLAGQIEAGSGTLFGLPVQDLSVSVGENSLLLRAEASGIEGVRLAADLKTGGETALFEASLDIQNSTDFLNFLSEVRKRKTPPPKALRDLGALTLNASYLPQRRFAGGPLPFSLEGTGKGKSFMSGNFLIYPESLDVRGTAETPEAVASGLQSFFQIPADKVAGRVVRLDGNLQSFFRE